MNLHEARKGPQILSEPSQIEGFRFAEVNRPSFDERQAEPRYNPKSVLFPYPQYDIEAIGGVYSGDICPFCGHLLKNTAGNLRDMNGNQGRIFELAGDSVSVVVLHNECYKSQQAAKRGLVNVKLGAFE